MRTWLALLRAPNLLTVPGDPLAGFLLAGGELAASAERFALVASASLALYAGGLIQNDLADREEDSKFRPNRPLASGRISVENARRVSGGLVAFGLGCAAFVSAKVFVLAAAIAALSTLYNFGRHSVFVRLPAVPIILLAACRGANVLLGAVAAETPLESPPALGAFTIAVYVASVSVLARGEAGPAATACSYCRGWLAFMPCVAVVGGGVLLCISTTASPAQRLVSALSLILLAGVLVRAGIAMVGPGRSIPPQIGLLLSGLLPLQAFLISRAPARANWYTVGVMITMLILWPLHRLLSRRFSPS